jgi:hypothetical protein
MDAVAAVMAAAAALAGRKSENSLGVSPRLFFISSNSNLWYSKNKMFGGGKT